MPTTRTSIARFCSARRYNPTTRRKTCSGPSGRLVPMPVPPREPGDRRRPQYMAMDTLELVARMRDGDELAYDVLCERYLPLFQRWARTRCTPNNPGHYDPNAVARIDAAVRDATRATLRKLGDVNRQGTVLLQLRDDVHKRLRDANPRPEVLETTIGPERAATYERALKRLEPTEREALVCGLELQRGFDQLQKDLGAESEDAARSSYAHAVVRLAEEMGHG